MDYELFQVLYLLKHCCNSVFALDVNFVSTEARRG